MVTTRGGHDTNSPVVNSDVSVTRSGRKRILNEENATPTKKSKRTRASADEIKLSKIGLSASDLDGEQSATDASEAANSQPTSEAPSKAATPVPQEKEAPVEATPTESTSTPKRGRGRPRKSASTPEAAVADEASTREDKPTEAPKSPEEESVYGTPAGVQDTPSVYATPATHLRQNGGSVRPTPGSATPLARMRLVKSTPSKPSKLSQTLEEDEDEEPTPKATSTVPPVKNTHIRLSSEDPPTVPEAAPEASTVKEIPSSSAEPEEQEESDDEAPEAVSTSAAQQQARAAESEAAKAIERQEAARQEKRAAHAARQREEALAAKEKKEKLLKKQSLAAAVDDAEAASTTAPSTATLTHAPTIPKPKYDVRNIPALLPDSLLAAAPDVRPATPEPASKTELDAAAAAAAAAAQQKRERQNKHLKFLDEKPVKDVRKGPVKVRVVEKQNRLLPPKASLASRSVRESWLAGKRGGEGKGRFAGAVGGERRKVGGGGFLRK